MGDVEQAPEADELDRGVEPVEASGFTPVDAMALLETLAALPVSTWSYVWDDPSVRHIGPMAQDFMAAFGFGADERRINFVDANGVATVAIQALYRRVKALEERLDALEGERRGRDIHE